MHGIPSSRETMAACEVIPPDSVTIALARRMIDRQFRGYHENLRARLEAADH